MRRKCFYERERTLIDLAERLFRNEVPLDKRLGVNLNIFKRLFFLGGIRSLQNNKNLLFSNWSIIFHYRSRETSTFVSKSYLFEIHCQSSYTLTCNVYVNCHSSRCVFFTFYICLQISAVWQPQFNRWSNYSRRRNY